ncbi:MAG: HAD family hydrolase [Clostridiales bacterium]|nr:HAD family hydrolase [Clostridiales bacterium]MBQ3322027.1 HAD-IA family hydrolase [Bacillota bacterium]
MIDTVIFDFDGTIMDTNDVIIGSWQHVYKTLRGEEGDLKYILSTFGEPLEYSMGNSFPEVSVDESVKIYRDWHRERFLDMIKLFPGITEMLQEVKSRGYKTAIASSRLRYTLHQGLEKYDLMKYFDTVVAVEDAENGKPAPDIVLKTLDILDSSSENSIMVGDSRLDILCARNAGVSSVLVGWSATLAGKTKEDFAPGEAPDFIIQTPKELLDII